MSVIAVATDFSTRSDRAIRRAELLAAQAGCDLLVVHVIDEDQPQSLIHAESDACEDLLRDQQEAIAKDGRTKVTTDLRIGEAFEQIPRAATDAGAMLIVMGPHRWQAARSAFIGTTVERTVKNSPLPVLVANSPRRPATIACWSPQASMRIRRHRFASSTMPRSCKAQKCCCCTYTIRRTWKCSRER